MPKSKSSPKLSKASSVNETDYANMQLALTSRAGSSESSSGAMASSEALLSQIFSTRRPRDFTAGLSSGLKSVTKGVTLGAVSLLVAPAYGAVQNGVGGFFKGLGAGVMMAIALPVAGVSVGITQTARGVFNTPEAIVEKRAGKKWDKSKREWVKYWYSLDEEHTEVQSLESTIDAQKKEVEQSNDLPHADNAEPTVFSKNRKVVDTTFYDTLQVPIDASQAQIRKNYYRLALKCHPDKHPDDPKAQERFQLLGEAYQVLGDEKRRTEYDQHGKDAAQNMSIIDSGLFFTMLFGSDVFEPYIGKLKMALFVETFDNPNAPGNIVEGIMEFEQRKREVMLAIQLRERIAGYVLQPPEKKEQWRQEMKQTAQDLCEKNFGDAILEAVGWVYVNYSTQYLGKLNTFMGVGGRLAKFQAAHREMGNVWRVAGGAVRASAAARRLQKLQEKLAKNENSRGSPANITKTNGLAEDQDAHREGVKQFEETLPLILETMLQICLMDVEATVRKACKKTLKDMSVDLETRSERANALIELGGIFREEAGRHKQEHKEPVDIMRQMEDAYKRATAEADKKNSQ